MQHEEGKPTGICPFLVNTVYTNAGDRVKESTQSFGRCYGCSCPFYYESSNTHYCLRKV